MKKFFLERGPDALGTSLCYAPGWESTIKFDVVLINFLNADADFYKFSVFNFVRSELDLSNFQLFVMKTSKSFKNQQVLQIFQF